MEALTLTNVRWTGDTNAKVRFPVCYDWRWDFPVCRRREETEGRWNYLFSNV